MDYDPVRVGLRIKRLRKKRGYSQMALAERVDISPPYLSAIENGQKTISMRTFVQIVNALNVTSDELLCDCLENTDHYTNTALESILSDCSGSELAVITDFIGGLKYFMRNNLDHARLTAHKHI